MPTDFGGDPQQLDETARALGIAADLAGAGIPIFLAEPDPNEAIGFRLPNGWQQTMPNRDVLDAWRPGMAVCAVMGHGLDLVDVDSYKDGVTLDPILAMPTVVGQAVSASGGSHYFVASLGVRSRNGLFPGIDVKAGDAAGEGRGFAFIAPTVRVSKATGAPTPYRWVTPPSGWGNRDDSGAWLAQAVLAARNGSSVRARTDAGPDWWQRFMAPEPQSQVAAERAIAEKIKGVYEWVPDSGANFRETLMAAAFTLGGYVGGGYLDEDDARDRLRQACAGPWPTANDDDELWISQGLRDGARGPFYVYTPEQEREWQQDQVVAAEGSRPVEGEGDEPDMPEPPPDPPWNIFTGIGTEPFDPAWQTNDQERAEAVAERMLPVLRYAGDTGQWVVRRGTIWKPSNEPLADWAIGTVARLMPHGENPKKIDVSEYTDAHWQYKRREAFMSSAGASRIKQKLVALVRNEHPITLEIARLDSQPEVLWAGGVPWDLRRCDTVPTPAYWIDPATPHLHSAAFVPDPTVPTPYWDAFLAAVIPDPEIRAWTLRVLSVALTGYPDAVVPILFGRPRSGKTSLVSILQTVLGTYAHSANAKLLSSKDTGHDTIVYDLKGRRLSFIDEGPKRGHDATERLKQLTGGGFLTARPMNANPTTFVATHTLVMTSNDEPTLTDPAMLARVRLVPCDELESAVRPPRMGLARRLGAEGPGILAQMMREAAGYLNDRDSASQAAAPEVIRDLGRDIAAAQDPVGEWVTERTIPTQPGTECRRLYSQFADWHSMSPVHRRTGLLSETAFGRRLTDLGYPRQRIDRVWHRPLSVLNGGGAGLAGFFPSAGQGFAPPAPAAPSGPSCAGFVPGCAGFETEPGTSDNTSSPPVFASSVPGVPGSSLREEEEIEKEGIESGESARRENPVQPGQPGTATLQPAETSVPGFGASEEEPGTNPAHGGEIAKPPSSRSVNASEVAARATEAKTTKAEARRQLAAEKRAAALKAAGGAVLPLPVWVDREGDTIPVSVEQAGTLVRAATARAGAMTVDVETSGYPIGHADYRLRTVQLGDEQAAVVFDPDDDAQRVLISQLFIEAPALHAHSATADLIPCSHAGLLDIDSAWDRMWDTAIPAVLSDPATIGTHDAGLKQLAPGMLGDQAVVPAADQARADLFKLGGWLKDTEPTTPKTKNGWASVDSRCQTMLRYAASDVLDDAAIARRLPSLPPALWHRERLAQRMTAKITDVGVRLDGERIAELTTSTLAKQAAAAEKLAAFGVTEPGSNPAIAQWLVSHGVPLPMTGTGKPSVRKGVLGPLAEADGEVGEFVSTLLDYRKATTAHGLFLEPYGQLVRDGDGRARPTIYTLGTHTGRMSSVRPNLQQVSKKGGIRECLTADPGDLIISADFSGVEVRVAAALSGDPNLQQFLRDGRDLHHEIAAQVWGAEQADERRKTAKSIVFGRMYGGNAPTLAEQAGVPEFVAQSAIDVLDDLFPTLAAWSAGLRKGFYQGQKQFQAYSGRIIHFKAGHATSNYAIQGSARELLIDTLVRWRDTPWGDRPLLPVHDELLVFVPAEEAQAATEELVRCMTTQLCGVDIVAEPSEPSYAWASAA